MNKEKRQRTTVTVRLTEEEYEMLGRLCALKNVSRTAYLADLATSHAQQELRRYAAQTYLKGKASFSELATKTGLDVPTIMDEVTQMTGEGSSTMDDFLAAVQTLAQLNDDPELYTLALKALTTSSKV